MAVSVILPVFNEASHIEAVLQSLLDQDAPHCSLEILVVDGGSSDGTRDIVRRYAKLHSEVRLLDNPGRNTPMALNIGLRAAGGEYACIFGAHAKYLPNYIRVCLAEMQDNGAVGCSGQLITAAANTNLGARLAAWCLAHRFSSSGGSVRTQAGGYVDTLPFPVIRKQALIEAGGYDERLERNQDNDMNHRLRAHGHKLYLTPRTQATYYARPGIGSLLRYAYTTGRWNGMTARLRLAAMAPRHFVPFAFVLVLLLLASLALYSIAKGQSPQIALQVLGAFLAAHLLLGTVAGIETAMREHNAAALLMAPVILAFHLAYGAGTAASVLSTSKLDHSMSSRNLMD
ncbi:MAG: glycosyl transferase [Candidatus Angelobacter sp.]|nr:glycosyl transferase [Candidatus Angelobacter sp.]